MSRITDHEPLPVKVADEHPVAVRQVPRTLKERGWEWLFSQGVSTVLLVGILGAIVHGVPRYIIPAIHTGYQRHADSLEKTERIHSAAFEKHYKLLLDTHERDRESFERAIEVLDRRFQRDGC